MPLVIAPIGKSVKILKCHLDDKTSKHLQNLGLLPGAEVVVVKENSGDVIVQIKESRIALNKQLARKILVA
ncbi:ferrous iron transport protein A [Breznakia sp. PF5-3]|uniref:FeoA family protein n=1 Tax=unclassified Breznakia TaxID=2623764 RepID=UPI00240671FB|nr:MULTISPECIES: FeoA family protein [unclassified Breznakia]MDF9824929.1 ferrous iron transport protein A [Breznakia sp. PM6-1]MDF9835803.1 ferrous iron transport protein A [Breznakia sp. PF5-3]MDF9837903.1 ferrous iron transport protein A [Breznakia sp. PFB2-8]MDF9859892.1 ferrous iron transport protein A [Breznakia sp. PH5-24]